MILGHARVETTRRYVRTSRERLRAAVESVALPGHDARGPAGWTTAARARTWGGPRLRGSSWRG